MKALIAIKEFYGRNTGDIVQKIEEDYMGHLTTDGLCTIVEYNNSIQFPKAVLVSEATEQSEHWSKEGEQDRFTAPLIEDTSWTFYPAEGEDDQYWMKDEIRTYEQPMIVDESWTHYPFIAAIPEHYEIVEDTQKLKEKQVSDLHEQMNKDVLVQMNIVFGTTNPESATAYKQTYDLMLAKPALWVGKLGLTDEAAVTAYATAKIEVIEQYAVWRMERIAQFKIERDQILGA